MYVYVFVDLTDFYNKKNVKHIPFIYEKYNGLSKPKREEGKWLGFEIKLLKSEFYISC